MLTLFEVGVRILIFVRLISGFQEILMGFRLVGGGISIHYTHVVNNVCTLCPEVSYEETTFLLSFSL